MSNYKLEDNRIKLEELPKNLKKITGTRLGGLVGVNPYTTEFEIWCDMMKVYRKPFLGNKYTQAGERLEPRIIEKLREQSFGKILTAEDVFGSKAKYMYDYYPDEPVFGGMWDGLLANPTTGEPIGIVEIKTTRAYETWLDGVPANYQTQAELYAYLSGLEFVTFGVVFLEDEDYGELDENDCIVNYEILDNLELVEGENLKFITYRLDDYKKEQIKNRMDWALAWREKYIVGLESPEISDHKTDQEIKNILMTKELNEDELMELVAELEQLEKVLKSEEVVNATKRKKTIEDELRNQLMQKIEQDDQLHTMVIVGEELSFQVKGTTTTKEVFNEKLFKEENKDLYEKYVDTIESTTYRKSLKGS